ncbi:hypothetical protein DUNSADRAFT_8003 [Dunaliella salina]|uniref:G-patch domain-containing protein n=1 Tax=Dunaliella salina TaxID=3046 RepID=A0ABQ7GKD6_DUNSA|nr:hypothetical protein DUNSADRAFT_8003 [Dunaliella salina]|eukprot:KAF5835059.1 hypothetical protein DUNSADRAFT_8003 [Dunaliella salina]
MVRSKRKRLLEGAYLGRGQYQYKAERPAQSQPVQFVSAGRQLEDKVEPQQQQQQQQQNCAQSPGKEPNGNVLHASQHGQQNGADIEQQRCALEEELKALEQRERHLLWLQQQQLQQQQILQRQRDEEQRQQDGCREEGLPKRRRIDDEGEQCMQEGGVRTEVHQQLQLQHPRQHEAGLRQQERDHQHIGQKVLAPTEQRRADEKTERYWLGQGVKTHLWQQQQHLPKWNPGSVWPRTPMSQSTPNSVQSMPLQGSMGHAPLSVRALKQQQQQQQQLQQQQQSTANRTDLKPAGQEEQQQQQQQQQQQSVLLPPPPPLPMPSPFTPPSLPGAQHLRPSLSLPLPPPFQAPQPPPILHAHRGPPNTMPLQPALPFAPEMLPPHLRQTCYFSAPNRSHSKKPLTKNGRKAARKKANKRAREQGLAPPGSSSAPPTKEHISKDAEEARAAAEAAQNKFAGFEDHTSGIGSRLLAKMGWRSGEGLGKKAQGQSEPVIPQLVKGKRGLGS